MTKNKLMAAVAIVAALAAVSACKKAGDTSKSAADSATNATTTSNPAVTAAEDKTAQAVGQTSAATVGATDGGFVTSAAMSDMYEVQAATLAEGRTKNPAIKKFAAEMVKAHTMTTKELTKALPASGVNVTPPAGLDERHKGLIQNLDKAKPEDFDKTYIDQQVAAHDEAVTLFKSYADRGSNATLKPWAAATLPKIQGHLDMAKGLQKSMK
jgi:putative membrane protein